MESFGIVMVVYMLVMLFSDIDNRFIDRSVFQELWAAIKASVVLVCVTALTIFYSTIMRRLPEVFILYCAGKYVPVFWHAYYH